MKSIPSEVQIMPTSDGSFTLFNKELDETYHSRHGALQESQYVFIRQGLKVLIEQKIKSTIKILEIGFGTGLNAWLTLIESEKQPLSLEYTALEIFPLKHEIWNSLNYAKSESEKVLFNKMHDAKWNEFVDISSSFKLLKREEPLQGVHLPQEHFDLIYFDAFAPNKQPEMWELPMLQKIADCMKSGGLFVTYCAKGQLKRDLKSAGLTVETLPGPPGKREMVRGVRN